MCPVCSGHGWVEAAPVVQRVTGEGEKGMVGDFATVPCMCSVLVGEGSK